MCLEGVRVGDVLASDGYGRRIELHTVERLTATQVITAGARWQKMSGSRIGHDWGWYGHECARVATPADVKRHHVQDVADKLGKAAEALGRVRVTEANVAAVERLLAECEKLKSPEASKED
jgi:hypothetical protein